MFATCKAWSSDNTLSGLSMESLLDLGKSLPSTVGHNDHEMPPKHGQICGYEGALLTGIWPLPAASTKIKLRPLQDADASWEICMQVRKQQLELDMEQETGNKRLGKGVRQGCILSLCLFNLHAEYITRITGLAEAQAGKRLPGVISITSDIQMTPPLWQKVKKN